MEKTETTNKRKATFGVIAGILFFGLAYFAVQQLFFKPPTFEEEMTKNAGALNKKCPLMVDQFTRLDNVSALPGNTFQYNLTLINVDKREIVTETYKQYIEPGIINNVKTNAGMKIFRDHKTTIKYNYKDKNGQALIFITVTPDEYLSN